MTHLYLIVGLGKTGVSVARFLKRSNKTFSVYDTRKTVPSLAEFQTEFPEVPIYLEQFPLHILNELSDIILSPGVDVDGEIWLSQAKQANIAIYGDIECLAQQITAPVIAITGTNGKSTVTTLVGEMAKEAGINVAVAGNIGTPVLDLLNETQAFDLWVLELSSFQLELTDSLAPIAATILNTSPDHLDRHHSLDAYINAKQRIYRKATLALYNRDDPTTRPNASYVHQEQISFGQSSDKSAWGLCSQDEQIYLAKGNECLFPVASLLIKGVHNWLNALAACALASAAGIPLKSILSVLTQFTGLPHRTQWVRCLDGVDWINDSKGTNIGATISAIHGIGGTMQGKIVLIAGGQGKGADFQDLTPAVTEFVRSVVLIGEDANKIEKVLAPLVPTLHASSLEEAVATAKTQAKPGDVVLLSPACASLDMFRNYEHRGDVFTHLVNGL